MMILHIILKIKNKVKFLIDLLNPCYTTSKHLYTIRTLRVYSYNHTWKKLSLGLGMGLIHIHKAHLQNSDLVGFISRPIHTHETQIWWVSWVWKNGFWDLFPNPVFFGCECMGLLQQIPAQIPCRLARNLRENVRLIRLN